MGRCVRVHRFRINEVIPVKMHHTSEQSYPSWLAVFCFFAGILLGTVWVNRMGADLREELGGLGSLYWNGKSADSVSASIQAEWGQAAGMMGKRCLTAGILWLGGMTLFALPGLCIVLAYAGFSIGFLISCMTVQAGLGGLALFLLSVFPQCLFYLPVGYVLFLWALSPEKRLHGAGFAVLLILTAAGTAAEVWLNPFIMRGAEWLLRG